MDCFLFNGLSKEDYGRVLALFGEPSSFKKGDDLYRLGFIGILLSGNATVCRTGDTGCETVIRSISSGEVFGAAGVFGNWKEGKSKILAKADCKVLYASEERLRSIFEQYPEIAVNYITFLSDRIRFLNRRVDAFSAGSTVQKLYEYLVSHATNGEIRLDYGLAELARRLKMGRSSLYRSLEVLENSGLLKRNKKIFTLKA